MKFEKSYLEYISQTAMTQIICGVGDSVVMSWGIRGWGYGETTGADGKSVWPCLILKVSGLIHTGIVVVALNEGSDTYEVQLRSDDGNRVTSKWHEDVYCDQLGALIDSLVERPVGMTEEEYIELTQIDDFVKMLSDAIGMTE